MAKRGHFIMYTRKNPMIVMFLYIKIEICEKFHDIKQENSIGQGINHVSIYAAICMSLGVQIHLFNPNRGSSMLQFEALAVTKHRHAIQENYIWASYKISRLDLAI
jgi:hypothetical protein